MDGYKKFILFGCLILGGGYFLPWLSGNGFQTIGYDILKSGFDAMQLMLDTETYDWNLIATFAAVALPVAGAALGLLYCLFKPAGGNGSLGTLFFVLPFLSLAAVYGYLFFAYSQDGNGNMVLNQLVDTLLDTATDLKKTSGLWLVHIGALMMVLGRISRGSPGRSL